MVKGLDKYQKTLILQAYLFRSWGINKKGIPREVFDNIRSILRISDLKIEEMKMYIKDDNVFLDDLELFELNNRIEFIVNFIKKEFEDRTGLNYVTYILVSKTNSLGGGLILPDNFQPDISMQLRNLLLCNKISLETNGYIIKEDEQYSKYIIECIEGNKERERKLFEDLKKADFS